MLRLDLLNIFFPLVWSPQVFCCCQRLAQLCCLSHARSLSLPSSKYFPSKPQWMDMKRTSTNVFNHTTHITSPRDFLFFYNDVSKHKKIKKWEEETIFLYLYPHLSPSRAYNKGQRKTLRHAYSEMMYVHNFLLYYYSCVLSVWSIPSKLPASQFSP